jgi:hypothetical protein
MGDKGGNWRTLSNSPSARAPDDGKWNDMGGIPDVSMVVIKEVPKKDQHKVQLDAVVTARRMGFTNKESKALLEALGIGERIDDDDPEMC